MDVITYHNGYVYQLIEDYRCDLAALQPQSASLWKSKSITEDFILLKDGVLTMMRGYAWDGPSGAIDTNNFMRGSLVHDALYQLIRDEKLDKNVFRILADELLHTIIRQDGMSKIRALWVYYGVRVFGNTASRELKKTYVSP